MSLRRCIALLALSAAACNTALGIDHDYVVASTAPGGSEAGAGGGGAGESAGGESIGGAPAGGASSDGGAAGEPASGGASGSPSSAGAGGAGGSDACDATCIRCEDGHCIRATAIATGDLHSCALLSDLSTWCWGLSDVSQFEAPNDVPYTHPVKIFTGATDLVAHYDGTCVLGGTVDGVLCWGDNLYYELATSGAKALQQPAMVPPGIVTLALGMNHSCGIAASATDRALWCWGDDFNGQLGAKDVGPDPVQIAAVTSPVTVSSGAAFSCAIDADGAVWCWGAESDGEIGDGVASASGIATPTKVAGLPPAKAITVGQSHACILSDVPATGSVHCWGANDHWQCGTSSPGDQLVPVQVIDVEGAVELTAGDWHTCARTTSGSVLCWGDNEYGQIGIGAVGTHTSAKPVMGLEGAKAIAAGRTRTCAIDGTGAVLCWGDNQYGQLGDGTTTLRPAPVHVAW